MHLSTDELMTILKTHDFYKSIKIPSQSITGRTLGSFLKDKSEVVDIAHDALGLAIEEVLNKVRTGKINCPEAKTTFKTLKNIESYLLTSVNNYVVDRSRRWGSGLETKKPGARARVEAHSESSDADFFDMVHQGVHTRTSLSKFKEGALEDLISKADLSDDEKWIVRIRSSDIKLSRCIGREERQSDSQDLTRSTCFEIENSKPKSEQKPNTKCTCHFVELTFVEIADLFGGKADTYQKRFKKATDKLRSVAEEV